MAKIVRWLKTFREIDPDASFIVSRPFALDGIAQIRGAHFDRTLVTTRLLRQLYEQRRIEMVDDTELPIRPVNLPSQNLVFPDPIPVVVKRKRGRPRRDRTITEGLQSSQA